MKRKKHPRKKRSPESLEGDTISKLGIPSSKKSGLNTNDLMQAFKNLESLDLSDKAKLKAFTKLRDMAVADRHALEDEMAQRLKHEILADTVEYPALSTTGNEMTPYLEQKALSDKGWEKTPMGKKAREDLPALAASEDISKDPWKGAMPTQEAMANILRRQIRNAVHGADDRASTAAATFVKGVAERHLTKDKKNKQPPIKLQQQNNYYTEPPPKQPGEPEMSPAEHASYAELVRKTFNNNIESKPHFDSNEDVVIDKDNLAESLIPTDQEVPTNDNQESQQEDTPTHTPIGRITPIQNIPRNQPADDED